MCLNDNFSVAVTAGSSGEDLPDRRKDSRDSSSSMARSELHRCTTSLTTLINIYSFDSKPINAHFPICYELSFYELGVVTKVRIKIQAA